MKALIILLVIFMSGCTACIKKPVPLYKKNDKGQKVLAVPLSCHYYEVCEYYKTVDKKSHGDCKAEFIKCCKDTDYRYCQDKKNLPDGVTFNSCFDKLN